jgi:hypothetical protein
MHRGRMRTECRVPGCEPSCAVLLPARLHPQPHPCGGLRAPAHHLHQQRPVSRAAGLRRQVLQGRLLQRQELQGQRDVRQRRVPAALQVRHKSMFVELC